MDPDTQGTLVSRCNPRRWYSGASPEVECRPEFLVDVHTDLEATLNQSLSDSVQLQPQKLVIRTRPRGCFPSALTSIFIHPFVNKPILT